MKYLPINLIKYFMLSLLCIFYYVSVSGASTLSKIPIRVLYDKSTIVAEVKVTQSLLLESENKPCGVRYHGTVTKLFKGPVKEDSIVFGYRQGLIVGKSYVVFLTTADSMYNPLNSTNSHTQKQLRERNIRCSKFYCDYQIIHSGAAHFILDWREEFDHKLSVKVPLRFVSIPDNVVSIPSSSNEYDKIYEEVWINLEAFYGLLNTFK